MSLTDRELLELAARAAGLKINQAFQAQRDAVVDPAKASLWIDDGSTAWNPLTDDGHALRLVVILRLQVVMHADWVEVLQDGIRMANATSEYFAGCMFATARAAIVRAAAEIQRREVEELICDQCRGEARVGGMDPAEGGKSCGACDGTGMYQERH
ncbi:hypothetical protein PPUJ13061_32190 [Pseudomonas putida]|uniref:hypothetical protein n=1 Tax=Pseudomonas putida TaxID=303 RepID=UPI0019659529|nr:hypothetical protein [Pseudomonas putida]WQE51615.1 hypothetical protein U0028_17160 [Pseudomonas putida]GLO03321.1 hypothetical protein PPUJ13061_32190 [Pseudomonas putida]HDS1005772.1 hypothetical protein [Pseudomonas putida]